MRNKDKVTVIFDQQLKRSEIMRGESVRKRSERLKSLRNWVINNRDRIKSAIYNDFKKPPEETDVTEVSTILLEINHALKYLNRWSTPEKVSSHITYLGTQAYVQFEPKGVCLIIAPWNYPFFLAISPLISAIAAGNTAIIKPSEMTVNTSNLISQMISELYPEDLVTVFEGGVDVSQALLALPFNHIFFTGSTQVGKIVMEAAAKNLSSVTLELGGKSPAIVDDSASIKDAAKRITWGKLINNGQTCVAPDYLLVQEQIKDKLVNAIQQEMENQFGDGGANYDQSSSYARLVNERHHSRLVGLIDDAKEKGAKVTYGGQTKDDENYLAPTLLENISRDSTIASEEIFGPILTIDTFRNLEEAVEKIKMHPKPLSMYIFSKKQKNINHFLQHVSAGGVSINETVLHLTHPYLPFGGVNHSGIGKAHGKYGFIEFSNQKSVLKQKSGLTSAMILLPPYPKAKKFVDLFINAIVKLRL